MCGDGMLDPMEGEECDDGNQDTTDSCVGSFININILLHSISKKADRENMFGGFPGFSHGRNTSL